jgi:hypothetical protein
MRIEIQIDWPAETGAVIQIQQRRIERAPQARLICVRPSRWHGHAAQSVLDALDQMVFAARSERQAS